jgi:hypothetical protein
MNKSKNLLRKSLYLFVGTGLVAGNLFQMALPAFAGQLTINNQATGTYDDGNGNNSTTLSNTVTITVEEVPAISINNISIDKSDASGNTVSGQLQPGDKVTAVFDVVSDGNDPTKIFIPGPTELNNNGGITNGTATTVIYQVKDSAGNNVGTAVTLTSVGEISAESVPVGGKIEVKVIVDSSTTAQPGDNVGITLGNTTEQGAGQNQNQDRTVVANQQANDVYTVDNADGSVSGEYPGVSTNVREASNVQTLAVNAIPKPFVKIEKTYGTYTENSPAGPENDVLKYNLNVTVPSTKPTGFSSQLTTDNLYPTFVKGLSGTGETGKLHVLISDVLPENTKLAAVPTSVPTNWTVVYSTDTADVEAYRATWTTTAPTDLNTVTRIGYIYDNNATTNDGVITKSDTPISGFSYDIKLTSAITEGSSIRNLAEVFGEESGKTPTDVTNPSVYDQSGDDTYNNDSDGNGTPDTPVEDTNGKPDTTNDPGDDTNNNNTGTGGNGEPNIFTVPTRGILNGTVIDNVNHPDAVGPNNNNDDFTNASAAITPTTVGDATFNNSVKNTSDAAKDIKLTILDTDLTDLPIGTTTITIAYTDSNNTTQTVTYEAVQTTVGGTPTLSITSTQTTPVTISNVAANGEAKYTVTVSLPDNATQNTGYDVPITAFIDVNNDNTPDTGDRTNKTIDRVYPGFVTLVKKSQVLDSTGNPVSGANGVLDTSAKTANNGERIKFVIEYTNISEAEPATGSNNVTLNANNLTITEDGNTATNNWAEPTSHVVNTAEASESTKFTINFFNGAATATNTDTVVTKYESVLNGGEIIEPQETGTFSFQRSIK